MFSNNFGNIKNVYLKKVNLYLESVYAEVGAISGQNSESGNISGWTVSGKIYNKSTRGIAGGSGNGKILNCYNKGSIDGSSDIFRCGGIIGYGFNSIENCYNSGEMKETGKSECYIGMLVGRKKDIKGINNKYPILKNI